MIYRYVGRLHSDLLMEVVEHCVVNVYCIVNCNVAWDSVSTDDILPEIFLMVAELMFVIGFVSIHFVKYSTATMANV
jgi:hypothetical protein